MSITDEQPSAVSRFIRSASVTVSPVSTLRQRRCVSVGGSIICVSCQPARAGSDALS
ncbi:hypothetical protein ACQPT8_20885 [Cronobacter sakazakii]|uniref:hypothetical protein n=1 Tax=Cronobacter sakazakii TaxID=28141 RepID=UPI003D05DA28